ncbi:MAG: VOC family protein [Gemmatimonadetes bacterium]|nr:VOC family protein [Gemmatimonadota bacterium]
MELEITIDVDDLDRAVEFYCGGLGLTLVERNPEWARVELNGQIFWLCRFAAGPHGNVDRDFRRHWTPIHLDFIVDDVDKAVDRALAAGGRLDGEIRRKQPEPIGCRSDVANLSDPAGNGVDLLQRLK